MQVLAVLSSYMYSVLGFGIITHCTSLDDIPLAPAKAGSAVRAKIHQ